jgi:ubiquinone/menaquinone biosynthesis C-methylase UbiE
MSEPPAVNFEFVKKVQQQIWSTGDFAVLATGIVITGELLCESLDVFPGEKVLDVACGSGNAAISAARRGAEVTGLDYVPALLERAGERAAAERMKIAWVEGDAEALPFADGSFDVVLSTFGSMFAPDQQRAADELTRVCRPGGRIGMANWTPAGFLGQMFITIFKHAPPPVPIDPPLFWGVEPKVRELFGDRVSAVEFVPREVVLRFRSPEHWLAVFSEFFGPLSVALTRLGDDGAPALENDLLELARRENRAGEGALKVGAPYIEVLATRA